MKLQNKHLTADFGIFQNISDDSYDRGYAAGVASVEKITHYATTLNLLFANAVFPEGYTLVIDAPNLISSTISQLTYNATGLHKLVIRCGKSDIKLASSYAFYMTPSLREIDLSCYCDTPVVCVTNAAYLFFGCSNLHTIHGVLDFSPCASVDTAFTGAWALQEMRIAPQSVAGNFSLHNSKALSAETVTSVLAGLADLPAGVSRTLTLHAEVGAKLTHTQKATLTAKNWTLVY